MDYDRVKYHKLSEGEKREVLQKLQEIFQKEDNIKLAYIFGSLVRRNAFRDIDIAVYAVPALTFDELLELGTKVELEIDFQVDLVQLQDLNPRLRSKVLMEGKPIIIRNHELHHRLISQSISEVQDCEMSKAL